ncbi:MAG: hypothetical protein KAI18_01680 [Candidatus Aenigmarchaeota archaeon]|nr:hypothetical protein [Candidatus Aenigmarchaeota archaeon]
MAQLIISADKTVETLSFELLQGAYVSAVEGNRLDIEKDGNKETYFLGVKSSILFISEFEIDTEMVGYLMDEKETIENPFSDLVGYTITDLSDKYFADSDKPNNLPREVQFISDNNMAYQVMESDCEILVNKKTVN